MRDVDVLAWALVILPSLDWIATGLLWSYSNGAPKVVALRERATAAVILSIAASLVALLALSRLGAIVVANDVAIICLSIALVCISVPQVWWLVLLATGRFGSRE